MIHVDFTVIAPTPVIRVERDRTIFYRTQRVQSNRFSEKEQGTAVTFHNDRVSVWGGRGEVVEVKILKGWTYLISSLYG